MTEKENEATDYPYYPGPTGIQESKGRERPLVLNRI
jgi:hypothetical protein